MSKDSFSLVYLNANSRYAVMSKLLNQSAKNKCIYLDAGCGKGDNILTTNCNVERIGIDIVRDDVRNSKHIKNDNYVVADLTALPFKDGIFDGVLCFDVLEHINDKVAVLSQLRNATRKGGFLVGCTTNLVNPILWIDSKIPIISKPLIKKYYYKVQYERHGCRLSPTALNKALFDSKYAMDFFILVGVPQFDIKRFHLFLRIWVFVDKLLANRISCYLREMMLWRATCL